jgi:hypothetical protein
MKRVIGLLAMMAVCDGEVRADYTHIIPATPLLLEGARKVMPPEGPGDRIEYHFRRVGNSIMVCGYHWGGNGGFCGKTTLSEVKQIDERAEDTCRFGGPDASIPHAMTGEAIWLDYECFRGHMRRKPYADVFDQDGYNSEQWKFLR